MKELNCKPFTLIQDSSFTIQLCHPFETTPGFTLIKEDKQQPGPKLYLSIQERCPEVLALRIILSIKGVYDLLIIKRSERHGIITRGGGKGAI